MLKRIIDWLCEGSSSVPEAVAGEVIKEIRISARGKQLVYLAMTIQLPFLWLPFATQIMTVILLSMALSHIKEVEKK